MFKFTLVLITLIAITFEVSAGMATLRLHTEVTTSYLARLHSVQNSTQKINIESFYLENDEIGRSLLKNILIQKNKNPAMDVRLLLDGWGSESFSDRHVCALGRIGGLQIKIFNKSGGIFNQIRTHRKIWLTDNTAIVGGRNLSNENLADFTLPKPVYSDWDVEVTASPVLNDIQNSFEQAWAHSMSKAVNCDDVQNLQTAFDEIISEKYEPRTQVVWPAWRKAEAAWFADPVGESKQRPVLNEALALLKGAQKSIEIENAFFIPVGDISSELDLARKRKVQMSFYLNGPQYYSWISEYTGCLPMNNIQWWADKGAGIYITPKNNPTHSKSVFIDGRALAIGSFNFDARSINKNAETLLVIRNSPLLFQDYEAEHRRRTEQALKIKQVTEIFANYELTAEQSADCLSKSNLNPILKFWF